MNGPRTVGGRCPTVPAPPRAVNWRVAAAGGGADEQERDQQPSEQPARASEEVSVRHLPPDASGPLLDGERSRFLRAVEVAAERVGARLVDLAPKLARLAGLDRGLC